jgi:molybdate transport system substrate-binding protein
MKHLFVLGLALLLSACRPPAPTAGPATLTVFAAASLTDAFAAIGRGFEAANPGTTVTFNFAGSNQLAAQINQGAPADVFASADRAQIDAAAAAGRLSPESATVFLTNALVVVLPEGNAGGIERLQDLGEPGKLIVLAAEEVPAGRYSLAFLDQAAADPAFGPGFKEAVLANVVSYEENVRAVLTKVALGEADAGIVYASDAAGPDGVALPRLEIPAGLNVVAAYPIAALNDSEQPEAAAAFIDYVLGPAGQAILREAGFGPARP